MSTNEHISYLERVYNRLLEHRYRYYVLDSPVLEDFEYDYIEKECNRMAQEAGVKLMEMVDFDPKDQLAVEAQNRVNNGTDYYSLWVEEMTPIWNRIGKPKKRKEEAV